MAKKHDLDHDLAALYAGERQFSCREFRILLVQAILAYFEGHIYLRTVLLVGSVDTTHLIPPIEADITEACSILNALYAQTEHKTVLTFTEHQRIENQLVALLDILQKSSMPHLVI